MAMTYSKYAHARDLEICNEDVFFERFINDHSQLCTATNMIRR